MRTQKSADMGVGVFVSLLGLFVVYAATTITGGAAHRLPPGTFPMVVGFLLFFCGLGLIIKAWRLKEAGVAIKWPDGTGIWTIFVALFSLACFIALMDPLGLPLAAFLYLAFSIWYLRKSKWLMAIVIALITGGVSYVLFIRLLALSFPEGFLFD